MLQCCHTILCYEILDQNWPVCQRISREKKPSTGSLFWGAFHSDHSPKVTKDVNIHFFIHSVSACDRLRLSHTQEIALLGSGKLVPGVIMKTRQTILAFSNAAGFGLTFFPREKRLQNKGTQWACLKKGPCPLGLFSAQTHYIFYCISYSQ
jgi:hypothetical protein